jgi:predicted nucleotidyltransferase
MSDPQLALVHVLVAALRASPLGAVLRIALLFGSATRGQLRPDSDLDVGIVPADANGPLALELELQTDLERATGRAVDLVRLDRADPLVRWEAARSGVLLLERPEGAAARFRAEAALEHADLAPLVDAGAERWRRAILVRAGAKR